MNTPTDVDVYIASVPKEVQQTLNNLRSHIKRIVPQAEEKMSYGMPYYGYKGRLVYFAVAKHHIGLYIPPPIIEDHAADLKAYVTSKSAIQFPRDQELPMKLIEKLIKARVTYNEELEKNKRKGKN